MDRKSRDPRLFRELKLTHDEMKAHVDLFDLLDAAVEALHKSESNKAELAQAAWATNERLRSMIAERKCTVPCQYNLEREQRGDDKNSETISDHFLDRFSEAVHHKDLVNRLEKKWATVREIVKELYKE